MGDRRASRRGRRATARGRLRVAAALGLVALVGLGGLVLHDSVQIGQRFEGSLWALPSVVYAAPVRLRPGAPLPLAALVRHLQRMGYRPGPADVPGTYRQRDPASLEIYVRSWGDAGGAHPAMGLRLRVEDDRIVRLEDADGRPLREALLEPERLATLWGPQREEREVVPLKQIPRGLVAAVLAAEDARFYEHHGVDVLAALRAVWVNLRRGRVVQGGSTITQQTVKNLFLSPDRRWSRKLRELPLALLLDARYPKDRILEVYLNEVYLGQRGSVAVCGVAAAARHYFGRSLHDLTLGEWALLAGLIRSPGHDNPFRYPQRALARRDQVLDAMERLAWIGPAEAARARAEGLRLAPGPQRELGAFYAADAVVAELQARVPGAALEREGLRIDTTLDPLAQEAAQQALERGLEELERRRPALRRRDGAPLEGAVVVTRPTTGEILALVGGRDYGRSQFNRAVQARRQPGSCFKPFVYLAGFEAALRGQAGGVLPATLLEDAPLVVRAAGRPWRPQNEDGTYRGPIPARESLELSRNVPTVRVALGVGLERVAAVARACGIESHLAAVPSLALGALEVRPVELAEAFGTLAAGGVRAPLHLVRSVSDRAGRVRWRHQAAPRRAVSAEAAFLVNDVLRGVLERGTARASRELGFAGDAAGKTGTSDGMRDAWFVGYQADWLALVWIGFDDARVAVSGAGGALPVWVEVARRLGRQRLAAGFEPPPGMVLREVDPRTGALATRACPEARREWFPGPIAPRELCPEHVGGWRRWWRRAWRDAD